MSNTVFFRLLDSKDKDTQLDSAIGSLKEGESAPHVHTIDPTSFRQVPGSPFAYWVSESVRQKFKKLHPLEADGRKTRLGASTMDDTRFLRVWWEVDALYIVAGTSTTTQEEFRKQTISEKNWIPYAKGGSYSGYYSDIHLVVNWYQDAKSLKEFLLKLQGGEHWSRRLRSYDLYFHPGLTWPRRTTSGISVRVLPAGCIFADKGPSVFSHVENLMSLLAIMNSRMFEGFIALQLGAADVAARSYEVGLMQRTPVPYLPEADKSRLKELAESSIEIKRDLDTANETSHVFHLPALLQVAGNTLAERQAAWQTQVDAATAQLAAHQREIDDIAFRLYGIAGADRQAIEESLGAGTSEAAPDGEDANAGEDDVEAETPAGDGRALAHDLLSYAVGCALGRWDVRYATGAQVFPPLPDPFAPLPVCSPGMLQGADGLPLRVPPPGYPLAVDADGILVDDPDHPDDILRRVRDVFGLIWGAQAGAIEGELAALLGVKDLRDYLRRGFFDAHLKRYSKSRRKAPIYWLLQSPRKGYGLWIYYHRLDADTLSKALTGYVDPALVREENRRDTLKAAQAAAGTGGPAAKRAAAAVDRQDALLADLREFRDRLAAATHRHLAPDLNDGVLLTSAPLHALVPWKDPRAAWDDLLAGEYAWSSIGRQLREQGLVQG